MNDWETFVVLATAMGLMPLGHKRVVYSVFAAFVLSRLMTLALLLFAAGLVYAQAFSGVAVATTLFAVNLLRRNGGAGAMLYTGTVSTLAVALLAVVYFKNEWLGLIVGVPWFLGAVIWFKLMVWVTDEQSSLNKLPYFARSAGFVCLGAAAFYGPGMAGDLIASVLPGWTGVAAVVAGLVLIGVVMGSRSSAQAALGNEEHNGSAQESQSVGGMARPKGVKVEPVWGSRGSMDMDEMAFFNNSM